MNTGKVKSLSILTKKGSNPCSNAQVDKVQNNLKREREGRRNNEKLLPEACMGLMAEQKYR